jgi:hypothetical protein
MHKQLREGAITIGTVLHNNLLKVRRVSVGSMVALPPRPSLKKIFKNEK